MIFFILFMIVGGVGILATMIWPFAGLLVFVIGAIWLAMLDDIFS
jgi:hypothetical protein